MCISQGPKENVHRITLAALMPQISAIAICRDFLLKAFPTAAVLVQL
jgi:hypothetical protein